MNHYDFKLLLTAFTIEIGDFFKLIMCKIRLQLSNIFKLL